MKINKRFAKMITLIAVMAMTAMISTACEKDNGFAFFPYEGDDGIESEVRYVDETINSSDSSSYKSGEHEEEYNEEYVEENDYKTPKYEQNTTYEQNTYSYEETYLINDESVDAEMTEADCSNENNTESFEHTEYKEENDETAESNSEVDDSTDYAEKADIRTNEVLFEIKHPKTAATEATIRGSFENVRGNTISMIGCTVYDDMGIAVATDYRTCNLDETSYNIEYDTLKDLGMVLKAGQTYYYNFVVEMDGELFTHKTAEFRTNSVDDRIAFELKDVQKNGDKVTMSAKVYNPTGAHVNAAGFYATTSYGLHAGDETIKLDTNDTEFEISFDLEGFEDVPLSGDDYDYNLFVKIDDEQYKSCYDSFTV